MGLLGKIWVKLGLDNSEFNKGIKESEGATTKFKNFLSGMGKTVAAAFSVTAILNFAKSSIKAYNESALALAKLENILKSTGNTSGFTSQQLQNYAMQLQTVTKFEDDATIAAMGVLASFKNIRGDVFKGVIKTAMDLSTVIGGDLQSNVYQLAKALERPAEGIQLLNRSTRAFSEAQIEDIKKLVAEGKTREAQMKALTILNDRFAGSAEAAAATAEGGWTRVSNAIGNLMENMGKGIDSTKKFANVLASTLEFLGSDTGKISFWQKLGLLVGSPVALSNMAKTSEQMKISRKNAEDYANTAMKGIKSVTDAEAKLASIEGMKSEGWDLLREKLVAYLAENKKVGAVEQDNAEIAYELALKAAAQIKDTIPYLQKQVELLVQKISLEKDPAKIAAMNQEVANYEYRLSILKLTTSELKDYNDLMARSGRNAPKLPAVTNNIAPGGVTSKATEFKPPKTLNLGVVETEAQKRQLEEKIKNYEDFNKKFEEETMKSEAIAQQFGQAVAQSISDSMQLIFDSIASGKGVDTSSLIKALVTPFADMAVQIGEVMIATGVAAEAAKLIGTTGGGVGAIAAGAILVALGTAAKSAIGSIGSNFGSAAGSNGSYGVGSGTGGGMGSWNPTNGANLNINVSGVLKGQDIYLAVEKTKANKNR